MKCINCKVKEDAEGNIKHKPTCPDYVRSKK